MKHGNKTNDLVQKYYTYCECKYSDFLKNFTDRSKDPLTEATGVTVVVPSYQVAIVKRTSSFNVMQYTVERRELQSQRTGPVEVSAVITVTYGDSPDGREAAVSGQYTQNGL